MPALGPMRALPPVRPGKAPRTSMGDLLGGGYKSPEPIVPDPLPYEAKLAVKENAQDPRRVASPRDTRQFLESQVVGPPRPWGAPPDKGHYNKIEDHERVNVMMPKWYPHEAGPALPAEVLRVEQEAAYARLAARLAAFERRIEAQEAQETRETETLERLGLEIRQMNEGQRTFKDLSEERFNALESGMERTKRQDAAVREHISILQKDFREFAVTAVTRQRSEIELEVSNAFARQNHATEEWRSTMKQRDAQLQSQIQRLNQMVEDASGELVRAQAELRTRISAMENSRLAGRAPAVADQGFGGADAHGSGHMVDYLKQQMDALRQSSEQNGARLAELWARCDGEAVSQHALKQDSETRFTSLSRAIATERDNLALRLSQRLEVLESRLGVERSEVAAKHAELHDVMQNGDHQGFVQVQDLGTRFRQDMEAAERRILGEVATLRSNVEADMAQLSAARATEEEARRASMASLVQRLEGTTELSQRAADSLRQEIDGTLRDLREAVRVESSGRTETERKLYTETSKAAQTLASELNGLQIIVKKQGDSMANELDQLRAFNTERADRLSRYVDDKVAMILGDPSQKRLAAETAALEERLTGLKNAAEEQARLAEQRIDACTEDIRNQIRQAQEVWSRELASTKGYSDKSSKSAERQVRDAQDELKARFEAYVKHFDSSIASVQAAILKPQHQGSQVHNSPRPAMNHLSPLKGLQAGQPGFGVGTNWTNPSMPAPMQASPYASPVRDYWRPAAEWQSEEMRSVVDGLRVHDEPDLASQVRATLSRGEAVVVKDVFERDRRRWASLGGRGGRGGFVLAFSEYGTPLLESMSTSNQAKDLFSAGGPLSPLLPGAPSYLAAGQGVSAYFSPTVKPEYFGTEDAQASPGRVLGPLVPITATGEAVQQLAEEVATGACNLDTESEERVDLQNMVRDLLVRGVVSGDFGKALNGSPDAYADADAYDDADASRSAEQVLSPDGSPCRMSGDEPLLGMDEPTRADSDVPLVEQSEFA